MRTYDEIRKVATGQGDDYTVVCLRSHNQTISKQQALDSDPKTIQEINFTGHLGCDERATMFPLSKKQKKPFWTFQKEL